MTIRESAILTCPICRAPQKVHMPTDACQFFYKCEKCSAVIKRKPGDCCVFCSYADTKCPSKQKEALVNFERG